MREIKKTDSRIVISENNQNQDLEMFISMKFDAECNEITPEITFHKFHEDSEILTKMKSKVGRMSSEILKLEKNQGQIWNQRPLQRWRPMWSFLV